MRSSSTSRPRSRGRRSPERGSNDPSSNPTPQKNQTENQKSNSSQPNPPQPNPPQQVQVETSKQPGTFQRVAETAAGVAVGSTVGNLVSNAVSGLFGSSSTPSPTPSSTAVKPVEIDPCEKQKLIFMHCTEKESDLTKCEELQKEYKECRLKYNIP